MLPHQVTDEVQPKWLQEAGGCVTLSLSYYMERSS